MHTSKIFYLVFLLLTLTSILYGQTSYDLKFYDQDDLKDYMAKDSQVPSLPDHTITFDYSEDKIALEALHEVVTNALSKSQANHYLFWEKRPIYTLKILVPKWYSNKDYAIKPDAFLKMLEAYIFSENHPKDEASADIKMNFRLRINGQDVSMPTTTKMRFNEIEYSDFTDLPLTILDDYRSKTTNENEELISLQKHLFDISSILAGANATIQDEVSNKHFYPFVVVKKNEYTYHYYRFRIGISLMACMMTTVVIIFLVTRKLVIQSLKARQAERKKALKNLPYAL